jgi:hypothetical protein
MAANREIPFLIFPGSSGREEEAAGQPGEGDQLGAGNA